MRSENHSVSSCCVYFNKSRQGYYTRIQSEIMKEDRQREILMQVHEIRHTLPFCGVRKLHYMLNQKGLTVGRDSLFTVLREKGLLIKRKRKYVRTTDSRYSLLTYENLIKEIEITHAEAVFVSDITYLDTEKGYCYLSIVGDSYSKKILGYYVSKDMYAHSVLLGLIMALKNRQYERDTIHHSDHGVQYSSRTYANACKLSNIIQSMAAKGKAWENPVAERMIGILKGEFGLDQKFKNYEHAQMIIPQVIQIYNTKRPHLSCGYLTPEQAHNQGKGLVNKWKSKSYQHVNKKEAKKFTTTCKAYLGLDK
jgi:putative transposase